MLIRKCISAYFTSWIIIVMCSFLFTSDFGSGNERNWHSASDFAGWSFVISFYVVPCTFIYGILVSTLLEKTAIKLKFSGPGEWLLSGFLHVFLGAFFGIVLQASLFSMVGGTAALFFFILDRLIQWIGPRLKKGMVITTIGMPILLLIVFITFLQVTAPPKPPFTAEDALQFATAGNGSVTDLLPDEIGIIQLEVEGYQVERETAIELTAQKERYLVHFIERWRKGEETGEQRLSYNLTRGSLTHHEEVGPDIPYRR